ncbi:translation initiation factor IF-2 [Patescibacteria group bacterium]
MDSEETKKVVLKGSMTVKDFAAALERPVNEVVKNLMTNGIMATINEEIDLETATIIAEDMGYEVVSEKGKEKDVLSEEDERRSRLRKLLEEHDKAALKGRAPIVTVMGHVDHGKTSLLDAIRETKVTAGEKGGITQHIGAYQVETKDRLITFLDTPGHEAFTAMRARGANITDIAVLVVAADDGVKPQTVEAIDHAKAAGVPIVVAINKIDKPNIDIDRVKKELADNDVLTEEWSGDTVCVEVSAKQKTNLDDLLEMIILTADMQDLQANPRRDAVGTVIEADKNERGGAMATILIQTGTLHVGDDFSIGTTYGKVRAMKDYLGENIIEAGPAVPVSLIGFKEVPRVGDILEVHHTQKEARLQAERRESIETLRSQRGYGRFGLDEMAQAISQGKVKKLGVVLKADVGGSLEAIASSLAKLKSEEVSVDVLHKAVGDISESDVMMAKASRAVVVGFNVKVETGAAETAKSEGIQVKIYNIIYELIDDIKNALEGLIEPEEVETKLATIKVLAVFRHGKKEMIFGGKVIHGKAEKEGDVIVRLVRDKKEISRGNIRELQSENKNVEEVAKGKEAGMRVEEIQGVEVGDTVEVIRKELIKKKLEPK